MAGAARPTTGLPRWTADHVGQALPAVVC